MNHAEVFPRNSIMTLKKICLFFILTLSVNQITAQNSGFNNNYPEVQKLQDQGALLIGELEHQISPGWWQYNQSCDRGKWISYAQKFEPRADHKASCDQQKHDFESVLKPAISKTTEVIVPADGSLISMAHIQRGEGIDEHIMVHTSVNGSDGAGTPVTNSVLKNSGQIISPAINKVKKGDRIFIKIEAAIAGTWGVRYFHPQGAKVQVYLMPDDPSVQLDKPPDGDGTQKCEGKYLEEMKKKVAALEPGIYILCTEGKDIEVDRRGNGDFEDALEQFEKEGFIKLTENGKVVTGENSNVVISFGKRGIVTVKNLTNFSVGRYIVSDEGITANTSLKVGEVDVEIDRRSKAVDFSVSTPACIAGVRGTEFSMSHEESPMKTAITVFSGEVEIQPTICSEPPMFLYSGQSITVDNNCFGKLEVFGPDFSNAVGKPCVPDKEFVRSLYQSVLERDLEVSFAAGYGAAHMRDLQNGESRLATVLAFFNSPEYKNKQKSTQEFIRDAHQSVLGREPSTNESSQWPRTSRNEIIKLLFNSAEYSNLMAGCPGIGKTSRKTPSGSSASSGIRVASATYGGNCNGVSKGNVTNHIAAQSNGKSKYSYTVDHRVIGDPAPGCAKSYDVRYRCGTNPQSYDISLPKEAGWGNKVVVLDCEGR